MKKKLIVFFYAFLAFPAMADTYIKFKASAIEETINTMVPESHRIPAADEYQKQMDSSTGKISVMGIYKVCVAAGFNINNTNGYNGCRLFLNTIAEKSGFGSNSANQQNCKTKFNGIWTVSADGTEQCVGKDGHKLVYHASCDGAGGDCIRDFSSLQTQEPNAREFIQAYGQQKNLQFTCWHTYDNRRSITSPLGQDYIKCSAGGKSYEFEFDDLIQDPGKTAVESENTALCEMFGGKIVKHPDSSIEKQWQSCDIARDICNGSLHNLAITIGHNVMYQGYCRLSRTVKETSVVGLKTLPGVDSRVFYNTGAQMRAGMAKTQTEEYLRTKFPNETYINCDASVKLLNDPTKINPEYVMTCTVGSKQVDFIFHDLTEGDDARAATGMDAMQCIISGGTFKGESCRGPTQAECDALDAALRAKGSSEGAKWDNDVRACIMGNAMKTYKRDVTTGYIVGAVVIVGGAIVAIGTGGAAVPVLVGGAEMLVTDLAINALIDINHRRLSKGAAKRYLDFVGDAYDCTTEQCALDVLEKHYATLSGVMNDLNKDDQATVDWLMDRLISLIQTEFVACGENDTGQTVYAHAADCAMQSSNLRIIDYIDKASEPVLIIGSVLYNPGYVTTRFTKLRNISKIATVDDFMDVAHMSATDRKFFAAYRKYGKRSQKFEDFKAMYDGDYAKLEDAIKTQGWVAFDEVGSTTPETVITSKTNYSTYSNKLDDAIKDAASDTDYLKYRAQVLNDNPTWKTIEETLNKDYLSGAMSYDDYSKRWDELARQYGTSRDEFLNAVYESQGKAIARWNMDIIPAIAPLDNMDYVAAERIQLYSEIIDKDPELRRMATRFDELTDSEKAVFGQKILDKSGAKTASGQYQFQTAKQWDAENPGKERNWSGLHSKGDKTIHVDTDRTLPQVMGTISHEDGHKIDAWQPEMGMLGEQKATLSDITYSNKDEYGYYQTLEERSSYAIGNAVENDFNRLQEYRFTTAKKYFNNTENFIDQAAAEVAATAAMSAVGLHVLDQKLNEQ